MTTKQFKLAINRLFRLLNKSKTFAKQKFWCCRSCAWWAFDDPYGNWFFVFTTEQSYKDYLSGSQYIYGNYPPNIWELIKVCGLTYTQRDTESAIELLIPKQTDE